MLATTEKAGAAAATLDNQQSKDDDLDKVIEKMQKTNLITPTPTLLSLSKAPMVPLTDVNINNWSKSENFKANLYIEPNCIDDMIEIVRNEKKYPSPIRCCGNRLSNSNLLCSDKGTLVGTHRLNRIIGFRQVHSANQSYSESTSPLNISYDADVEGDSGGGGVEKAAAGVGVGEREESEGEGIQLHTDPEPEEYHNNDPSPPMSVLEIECGVVLKHLEQFLDENGLEIPFSPAFNLATVGGMVFNDTYDSSIGPLTYGNRGDFQSCIMSLLTIDDGANVQEVQRFNPDGSPNVEFQEVIGSHSTKYIVINISVLCRKKIPIQSQFMTHDVNFTNSRYAASEWVYNLYLKAAAKNGNVSAILTPTSVFAEYCVPRKQGLMINPLKILSKKLFVNPVKKNLNQKAHVPKIPSFISRITSWADDGRFSNDINIDIDVCSDDDRLTYSFAAFEIIENNFVEIVSSLMEFTESYYEMHGFRPDAFSISFINQDGRSLGGAYITSNPGDQTVFFTLNPTYHNPNNPGFYNYVKSFNRHFVTKHEGRLSLSQSLELDEHLPLATKCLSNIEPSERFTNAWTKKVFQLSEALQNQQHDWDNLS